MKVSKTHRGLGLNIQACKSLANTDILDVSLSCCTESSIDDTPRNRANLIKWLREVADKLEKK